jgi:hypothetical protein
LGFRNNLYDIIYKGNISLLEDILPPQKLKKLTPIELRVLRNTIFAKHGYDFASTDLRLHFSQFAWYAAESNNVDDKLTEIDNLNIALIQYHEINYAVSGRKESITWTWPSWPKNIFGNTILPRNFLNYSEPICDIEITLGNDFANKKMLASFLKMDDFPFNFIRNLITDSVLKSLDINYIFIGINFPSYGGFDYITAFDIKDRTFSLTDCFRNFDLQTDRYNNDISVIRYYGQQYYIYYSNQRLYISKDKNLVYESANGNLSKKQFILNRDIDINISSKLGNLLLGGYFTNLDYKYIFISLKESEKYMVSSIIVSNDNKSAQGIYNILNGLKQTTMGFSELRTNIIPQNYASSLSDILKETNVNLNGNNVEIDMTINPETITTLLPF